MYGKMYIWEYLIVMHCKVSKQHVYSHHDVKRPVTERSDERKDTINPKNQYINTFSPSIIETWIWCFF